MTSGTYGVYKPKGMSSYDVIRAIKKTTDERHIGHAGTLDPLAEGVLVVGVGREATRKLKEVVGQEKEYVGVVRLGATSTTDDEEGGKTFFDVVDVPSFVDAHDALQGFRGVILQTPPVFSALKVGGERLYKKARRGEEVLIKPREVLVKDIVLEAYTWPLLKIRVTTGPGVYIRALARDIGKVLGCGGYLQALMRVRVGDFSIKDSIRLF